MLVTVLVAGCEVSRTSAVVSPATGTDNNNSNNNVVGITLAPTGDTVQPGGTVQFFATVSGSTNSGVTWSVSSGVGSVDSNGLYTAPATIASDTEHAAVKAVAAADPAVSATVPVVIIKPVPVGTDCDTTNVTYTGTVKPILKTNCYGCHTGAGAPLGIDLSNYNTVKNVATAGKLYGVITHSPGFPAMPKGANKLSDCSIARIKAWIDKGAQND
jgi:hypothetical protein